MFVFSLFSVYILVVVERVKGLFGVRVVLGFVFEFLSLDGGGVSGWSVGVFGGVGRVLRAGRVRFGFKEFLVFLVFLYLLCVF